MGRAASWLYLGLPADSPKKQQQQRAGSGWHGCQQQSAGPTSELGFAWAAHVHAAAGVGTSTASETCVGSGSKRVKACMDMCSPITQLSEAVLVPTLVAAAAALQLIAICRPVCLQPSQPSQQGACPKGRRSPSGPCLTQRWCHASCCPFICAARAITHDQVSHGDHAILVGVSLLHPSMQLLHRLSLSAGGNRGSGAGCLVLTPRNILQSTFLAHAGQGRQQ